MMTRSGVGTVVTLLTLLVTRSNAQDTVRVRADGPPAWGPEVRLVQEVAIGELDGPQEYAFGRIDKGAMEPSGGFYLFDANDGQIRRYDRSGRFLNLVGRKGGGPGEYESVAMAVTRDGLLVVWDGRNSRVTYFQPDGKVMDDFPMTRPGFYGSNFVIDTAGFIYQTVGTGGPLAEGAGSRQQYLRFTPAGALHDSILLPDRYMPPGSPRRFSLSTSDGMRWNFVEQRIVAPYAGGGVISGTSHRYRYAVTVPGKPVLVVERAFTPLPLGDEEREDWLRAADSFKGRPDRPDIQYEIPHTKPPIRAFTSDHLGRVWVEVSVKAEKRNEPKVRPDGRPTLLFWKERTTYDVFSGAGQYLGRVSLTAESELLDIRDNRLLVRGKGADGEDRVLVYRMAIRN